MVRGAFYLDRLWSRLRRDRVGYLKRDEFRFALPFNQSPFVPAEAGTQKPSTFASQSLGPRFRGDERN